MSKQLVIGYAGMTHLGINYSVATAGKGFNVIGYDQNNKIISDLIHNKSPVIEPDLDESLVARKSFLTFTSDVNRLVECDIVYISTDVSTDNQGNSKLEPIIDLINQVCSNLHEQALLIVLCQVPTGFTRKINWPKQQLYYQVETLVFGQALKRAEQPERLIIGVNQSEQELPLKLQKFLQVFDCPIVDMTYESAELTKMAINCYLAATVTITNTLAELCEQIGANWAEIIPALQLDKRIGKFAYLKPGLGLSGGNLERDLTYIASLACENGTDNSIIKSVQSNSIYRKNWVLRTLYNKVIKNIESPAIAIWGLTYKENTHSLKNSPSIELLNKIKCFNIKAYDPVIKSLEDLPEIYIVNTAVDAVKQSDVLIIMTPWQEFFEQKITDISDFFNYKTIIDPFAVLSNQLVGLEENGFTYYTLGS